MAEPNPFYNPNAAPGYEDERRVPGNPSEDPGKPVPTGPGLTDPVEPQPRATSVPPPPHTNTPGRVPTPGAPGSTPPTDLSAIRALQEGLSGRSQQFGPQAPSGAGTSALGELAGGGWTRGMQGQHDALQRSIIARMAGARGSQNVGLQVRGAVAEGDAATQKFVQTQAEREFQVANAKATIESKTFEINKKVEADLLSHRDSLIQKYEEMGMSKEQYSAELEAAMDRLKKQLTHDYWSSDLEAQTALQVTNMQESDTVHTGRSSAPGYNEQGEFQDQYWFTPQGQQEMADEQATYGDDNTVPSGGQNLPQEVWDTMTPEQKAEYRRFYNLPREDTGGPEDDYSYNTGGPEDDVLNLPSLQEPGRLGYKERPLSETMKFDSSETPDEIDARSRAETTAAVQEKIKYIQRAMSLGVGAYQLGSAKNRREREAAALGIAKSEGAAAVAQFLGDKLSSGTAAGALTGLAKDVSEAATDDNKGVSQGDKVGQAAGKAAASTAGAAAGGAALTAAAPVFGAGAPVAAPILEAAGSTLGGVAGGALYDEFGPSPSMRTTNPQEMIAGSMGVTAPGSLRSDPLSLLRDKERAINSTSFEDQQQRRVGEPGKKSWDVGGPEDEMIPPDMAPPKMPLPANSSYDFLENISSGGATNGAPGAPSAPESNTMSALGDLHERLKEIEAMLGAGGI